MVPRLLVLGAGGFLGGSIARHLADTGEAEVIAHSRSAASRPGFGDDFESHSLDLLTCAPGAIADLVDVVAPDAVVNCTGTAVGDPDTMKTANVVVVVRLIAELEECRGVHLVHLGSAAEYGLPRSKRPVKETTPATPESIYGVTKLKATEQLMRAAHDNRISVTVLRVFNPIGRFSPESTLPGSTARKIAHAMRTGAREINLGVLDSWRDYVDTRDIARAVVAASISPRSSVLNVGRGEAVKSLDLVASLAAIAGFRGAIVESDARSARSECVNWMCADVQEIKTNLGWTAEHSIEESLDELWSGLSASRQ